MFTTFEDFTKLGSSRRFALAVQHLFVLACALRWSEMARFDDEDEGLWQAIAQSPSPSDRALTDVLRRERARADAQYEAGLLTTGGRHEAADRRLRVFEKDEKARKQRAEAEQPGADGYDSEMEMLIREEEGEYTRVKLEAVLRAQEEVDEEEIRMLLLKSGELDPSQGGGQLGPLDEIESKDEDTLRALLTRKVHTATEDDVYEYLLADAARTIFEDERSDLLAQEEAEEFLQREKGRVPEGEMGGAGALADAVVKLNLVSLERVRYRRTIADKLAFMT
jgi:hypothetical protein